MKTKKNHNVIDFWRGAQLNIVAQIKHICIHRVERVSSRMLYTQYLHSERTIYRFRRYWPRAYKEMAQSSFPITHAGKRGGIPCARILYIIFIAMNEISRVILHAYCVILNYYYVRCNERTRRVTFFSLYLFFFLRVHNVELTVARRTSYNILIGVEKKAITVTGVIRTDFIRKLSSWPAVKRPFIVFTYIIMC